MNGVTDGVIHGGTYNGLTSTVAACTATITTLAANNGALYKKMERQGKTLIDGMNTMGRNVEELQHRGVRTTSRGTWFMSSVLTDNDIQETLNTVDAALEALQQKSAKG